MENGTGPGRLVNARRNVWLAASAVLIVLGTFASVFSARALAQADGQRSLQALGTTSAAVASTLELAIQREQDLAESSGAFLVENPDATEAEFLRWTASVSAFERYPDLHLIGEIVLVPDAQLSAFEARWTAQPTQPASGSGAFQVIPAGTRPYYCLQLVSATRSAQTAPVVGFDYCDSPVGPALLKARDSGKGSYNPIRIGAVTVLGVGTPVYRGGIVPKTVEARRTAFMGWTGLQVVPTVVLTAALKGHPDTAVAFHYGNGSSKVTFAAGRAPAGAQSTTISLHNGWHVQTFGAVTGTAVLSNEDALALLLAGIVLSLLLGILIYVLGTSRSRAMLLVNEQIHQLRHQALHDSLTGLPNRALILDRIDQMLVRARRSHIAVAALFLDLDDFKDINDTLGHTAGDQLLVGVGARLAHVLREGDTVGRLGGDEFVVLVEGASLAAGAEVVASRVLDALEPPFEILGSEVPLSVTASVGVAVGYRETPEELLQDADIALYRAKAAGKHRAVVFSPSMQVVLDSNRSLALDLRRALDAGEFFLLYQPILNLSTGAITGVEALLRWQHPERGVVGPENFISALEVSGLIIPLGERILVEACRQGAIWHRCGHRISVSVNISARQLERDRIVDDIQGALSSSGLDPSMLTLELTETALMSDVTATASRLELMKALGVRLAIDDFGTGYSSLAYLRRFPIDVLKIDQSFVSGMAVTNEAAALVHMLVQLGKSLGLQTVAEGIETHEQLSRLRAENVDEGQGFLFASPLDAAAMGRLLENAIPVPQDVRPDHGDAKSPGLQLQVRDRRSR